MALSYTLILAEPLIYAATGDLVSASDVSVEVQAASVIMRAVIAIPQTTSEEESFDRQHVHSR